MFCLDISMESISTTTDEFRFLFRKICFNNNKPTHIMLAFYGTRRAKRRRSFIETISNCATKVRLKENRFKCWNVHISKRLNNKIKENLPVLIHFRAKERCSIAKYTLALLVHHTTHIDWLQKWACC